MNEPQPGRISLQSYTIPTSNLTIQVGDDVILRPESEGVLPYVVKIDSIYADPQMTSVRVQARWYYRPEDTPQGRRLFHGLKELFLSDHSQEQYAQCIDGKCKVHSFDDYQELQLVMHDDYFCRFQYLHHDHSFIPQRVEVFCICNMPLNPDLRMIMCEGCLDWFHLRCLNMSLQRSRRIPHYYCESCGPESSPHCSNPRPPLRPPPGARRRGTPRRRNNNR